MCISRELLLHWLFTCPLEVQRKKLFRDKSQEQGTPAEFLTRLLRSWALQQAGNINLKPDENTSQNHETQWDRTILRRTYAFFFFFLTAKLSLWILNGTNGATTLSCLKGDFHSTRIAHSWAHHSIPNCAARKWSHGHTEVIKIKSHGLCGASKLKLPKKINFFNRHNLNNFTQGFI